MKKLYWMKLKPTIIKNIGCARKGHWTGLSQKQVVQLIFEEGVNRVEKILHDDKTPRNTKQLNGNEMLEIWKDVAAKSIT